jgi:two-component system response regulator DegU
MTKQLRPDVVVMDITMPLLNGLEATRQIHQDVPDTKVLILSVHNEAAYVQQAIELGAVGFLLKQESIDDMPRAIREVQTAKSFYLGPSVARPAA